jgi:hypothetical protein
MDVTDNHTKIGVNLSKSLTAGHKLIAPRFAGTGRGLFLHYAIIPFFLPLAIRTRPL